MANSLDERLKGTLAQKMQQLGVGLKGDGSIGYADPEKDKLWKQFQQQIAQRGASSSAVSDTSSEAAANALKAMETEVAGKRLFNDEITRNALAQLPIVQGKEEIKNRSYKDRLGGYVGAQSDLLGDSYSHEQALDTNTTDRLDRILAAEDRYNDKLIALNEKQMGQQNTANILNLITKLALGGVALVA
jgi:chromosome segregation ATPase